MASLKERKQMNEFVRSELERSGYEILPNTLENNWFDGILIRETQVDEPSKFYVACHSFQRPMKDYKELVKRVRENGASTADIFLMNRKMFMRPLTETRGIRKETTNEVRDVNVNLYAEQVPIYKTKPAGSFKGYEWQDVYQMVSLRQLELLVSDANHVSGRINKQLVCYQPKTNRLNEGVRVFNLRNVVLNADGFKEGDRGYDYVESRDSKVYRIADEIKKPENSVLVISKNPMNLLRATSSYKEASFDTESLEKQLS